MNQDLKDSLLEALVIEGVEVSVYPYVHRADEETHIVGKIYYITTKNHYKVIGEKHTGEYGQIREPGYITFSVSQITSMSIRLRGNQLISYVNPTSVSIAVNTTGEPEWQVGDA